jgi:cyclophilin family peptidyl-prolyl cis-trans isomerase/HEAT repeat protein
MSRPLAAACAFVLVSAAAGAQAPPAVVGAERAWAGPDVLLPLAKSQDPATATAAIRALGRLQDRDLVEPLLTFAASPVPDVRLAAASALAQTLVVADPKKDAAVLSRAIDRLVEHRQWSAAARLAQPDAAHAAAVEALLDDALRRTEAGDSARAEREDAIRAFESLARRNARLAGFALRPESVALLESSVLSRHRNDASAVVRRYAIWTLAQSRAATAAALRAALSDRDDQARRVAVQALGGSSTALDAAERTKVLGDALKDPAIIVRVEAVRSFATHATTAGACGPLLDVLHDEALHVVNVALDALASACPADATVTARLAAEAVSPPPGRPWYPAAHALVALAGRDRDRVEAVLPAFAAHPTWQVRMYAAHAATILKDEAVLNRLATDASDNVRSAALPGLRAMSAERARPAIVAALGRNDYQLLRTAATILKDEPPSHALNPPLADALQRATKERKQTTRDARIPLLDAIAVHGSSEDAADLEPLLKDIDPEVAARAAVVLKRWGRTAQAEPSIPDRTREPLFRGTQECVSIEMAGGRHMRLRLDRAAAPVTSDWFLNLALDRHYYDGYTFHRVEPNFVIQGGSPGANEYSSALEAFKRDEINLPNVRGAVGLSTRGLNTADGQIYVMLVDDPRLDGRFTIFAHVFDDPEDLATLDGIQEGATIKQVTRTTCPRTGGAR